VHPDRRRCIIAHFCCAAAWARYPRLAPAMAFAAPRIEEYDSSSSTDSADTARTFKPAKSRATGSSSPRSNFLFPSSVQSGRSSLNSSAANTPVPSRSASPLPQFRTSASSSTSDTDSETTSPLLRANRRSWWLDDRRKWWTISRRRRKRHGRIVTSFKKWSRWLLRHPFFPRQPITIVSFYTSATHGS
jgi:hypothetical protein